MDDASLLVDQRSASLAASEADVRMWATGRRVFVSSLITDMPGERSAVRAAIEAVGATPVMFEDLGAQDVSAEQAYLSGVRSSEVYVGMWGPRYGVRMGDGYSATHAEFLEAERDGLRLCLFVHGDKSGEMDGPQRDLIRSARSLYTTGSWRDVTDLGQQVRRRLEGLAAEELAPWVRVGRTLFRAREITDDGRTITIDAVVRSDAVHSELVRLRDQRSSGVAFASPSDAQAVQIAALSTRIVSTVGHEEHLTLVVQGQRGSNMRAAINGVAADEVTRRALSDGLFGTSMLGQQMAWLARPIDPLAALRGLALDDSILRPAARLLFGERLVFEQIASRIDSFNLGPSHQGMRRLRATWTPPQLYTNEPDLDPLSIDGTVTGL
ncbi:DUF4062 domain-containing protein [Propionicimonas sp.]|uniref:DUF4062 domain-containing protein n=1 Tax=Propionicimonas sp. TaxID=1955623 RepID=UPI0017950F57|nr:DUF4062 domain-containing protein [Propionicimonas sp.]MBU3977816.1 DUF4062 domain-containing protein [Actinomycetota bacterium]MBA3021738.1 DUF4062 domain-containing protein [Propionicimonas sp.]MBU3987290.1 DUF4062 domain-containing protein [Actinomycetota bacterium]MBU4009111.1 DUF4062 domain-containing protein [Actinomycetota bacterium]MBU4065739.1 DUF4062 domain-containing protein [Actinomycetota bacterium]